MECLRVERQENRFNKEWRERVSREVMRFNGKAAVGDGQESISDATSEGMRSQKLIAQQQAKPKSAMKQGSTVGSQHQLKFAKELGRGHQLG